MAKLGILIPTIVGREEYLERLLDILTKQAFKFFNIASMDVINFGDIYGFRCSELIILVYKDDRKKTIGEKRNFLTELAVSYGCSHRAFIDDDDTVTDDYLELNMPGVYADYDCNSLVGIYSVNGVVNPDKHIFIHSLKFDHWWEDEHYYYRNPNHLNVVKLDLIKDIKFQEKNFGEDGCFSEDVHKAGVLKNEYHINKPFYNYLFRTKPNGI